MVKNPKKEKLAALKVEQLKPKAKRLGVKLTNPSGNAKTKAQLINAIVKAEEKKPVAKKPAAKKPAAKKRVVKKGLAPVTGASKQRDAKRQAKAPGRRVSSTGRVYYERRSNRADAKQGASKGQMLGGMLKRDYIKDLGDRIINDYFKYDENTDFGDAFNEVIDSYVVYYNEQWQVVRDLGYYNWEDNDLGIQPTDVGQVCYLALYELYGDVERYVDQNM
jgi:hypothetical protein